MKQLQFNLIHLDIFLKWWTQTVFNEYISVLRCVVINKDYLHVIVFVQLFQCPLSYFKKKRLKLVFERSVVKCEQLHVVLVQGHNHNVM